MRICNGLQLSEWLETPNPIVRYSHRMYSPKHFRFSVAKNKKHLHIDCGEAKKEEEEKT